MQQDPKTAALTMYASFYVHISRMTNYYQQAKPTSKKCCHESIDGTILILSSEDGYKTNKGLIDFHKEMKNYIDEI